MELTLVVLAAGAGSRFGGLKQLAPVGPGGEALFEYSIYDAVRAGFKSRAQAAGERGGDVREIDRQVAADNERADEMGIVYDSDPRHTSEAGLAQDQAAVTEDEPEDEEESDDEVVDEQETP